MAGAFTPDMRDMLTGDVRALVLRLGAPSLTAMLAQSFGALADALLLSTGAPEATAAAGVCFPLLTAQQAVGFTLGMGAGSHVSRELGAGSRKSAEAVASAALLLALLLGALLTLAGLAALTPLLTALGADAQVLPHAAAYGKMLLLSAPAACCSLVLSSLLRAQGRTAANLAAYAASVIAGTALGYALIMRAGMGAAGAGISLLARECLSLLILSTFTLNMRGVIRPSRRSVTLRAWVYPAIMRSGLPTLLRQGAASLSAALSARIAAGFGPAALAGMGLAARACALVTSAAIGLGQGFQPVCGVNFGAGKHDRVRGAYRFCLKTVVIALAVTGAACFLFADRLLALFSAEPDVAGVAARALRAQSIVFFAQGAVIMMNMLTQSMGMTVRATLCAVSRQGIFLIPLLLILPRRFGLTGLILCQSADDLLALLLCFIVSRPAAKIDKAAAAH